MEDSTLKHRLAGYLSAVWGERVEVSSLSRFEGGVSNLTYHVRFEQERPDAVLRLQREHGIFEPYDVLREARVLRCLRAGPVPVPEVLLEEAEPSQLGGPFFVMEYVEGRHFGELPPQEIPAAFTSYIEAVAAIHSADWQALGLGFLKPEGRSLVEADLAALQARACLFACEEAPLVARLTAQLAAPPAELEPALCQGDINVFNYIYADGKLAAVVDWEQAGVGDRRLDLGLIACLSMLKQGSAPHPRQTPIISMYEAQTGLTIEGLPWFVTLAACKLAVIHYGWKLHNGTDPWFSLAELEQVADAMLAFDG